MYKKNSLFFKIMRYMIVNYIRSSYMNSDHRFALRNIFKIILMEQRATFREDNEVTTVAFAVEQVVKSSRMSRDWGMTEELMDLAGDPDWKEQPFTNDANNFYTAFYKDQLTLSQQHDIVSF